MSEVPDSLVNVVGELERLQDDMYGLKGRIADLYEHVSSLHKRHADMLDRQVFMLKELERLSEVLDKAEKIARKNSLRYEDNGDIVISPKLES